MNILSTTLIVAAFATFSVLPATSQAMSDEAQIKGLEDAFTAAFNAKDVDAIMKVYVPDASLVVFDVVNSTSEAPHSTSPAPSPCR
jgi:hypothetical protein